MIFIARRPSTSASKRGRCRSCRNSRAWTAAWPGTGETRTKTPGPTAAGIRPTWEPCCAASFAERASPYPRASAFGSAKTASWRPASIPRRSAYEAVWKGGFVKFSNVRHGLMEGLILSGTPLPRPEGQPPAQPFRYHGFYRNGKRVIFSYRIGQTDFLDAPWVENGKFVRQVARASEHPSGRRDQGRALAVAAGDLDTRELWVDPRNGPTWSIRSSRRFEIRGTLSCFSAVTTFSPTEALCSARCRETSGTWTGSTRHFKTSDGAGMPADCTRRWGWSFTATTFMSWAATRSPGFTTRTATAKPTCMSASATPTARPRRGTTSSAASSATSPAGFTPRRASSDSCVSPPTGDRSRPWRPASVIPTVSDSRPTVRSRCPTRKETGRPPR